MGEVIRGILIPFLGTTLGASCVLFMKKMMNMAIAAVLGAMIGLFVVFLIEYLDNKLKTPQDIEKHLGLSVLGVVPNEKLER